MGEILDQCCRDAWDIMRGRKRIVRGRIVEVPQEPDEEPEDELEETSTEASLSAQTPHYGWLSPDGKFHPVGFAEHQAWAANQIREMYRSGALSIDEFRSASSSDKAGDWLTGRGWVLIHNPSRQKVEIHRDIRKGLTKAQKEFLYEYLQNSGNYHEAKQYLSYLD